MQRQRAAEGLGRYFAVHAAMDSVAEDAIDATLPRTTQRIRQLFRWPARPSRTRGEAQRRRSRPAQIDRGAAPFCAQLSAQSFAVPPNRSPARPCSPQ
jgi:hypothetical protein